MARTSKADKLKRYATDVEFAVRWREERGYDQLWHDLIDMYKGKMFPEAETDEDRVAINVAFSTINVIYPSVSINYPKIGVSAADPQNDPHAAYGEVVMNYYWRHYDYQDPFRLAVKDFLIIGHGWAKTGWTYLEDEVQMDEDEVEAEYQRQVEQQNSFAAENPELAAGLPNDAEILENLVTTKTVVREDRPFLDRVSPFDVYVNPDATSMRDVRWIAQRIIQPLADAKADKRYRSSARSRLKANAAYDAKWMSNSDRRKYADELDRVIVWEFYDLKENTLCVFAEGSDEYLVDPMQVPFHFGHPFVMLRNYDVPGEFYPVGELEMLRPMNDELNKTRSMMMNHRKRYARKWLIRDNAFDERGRRGLVSDDDGAIIPVIDQQTPLSDVMTPVPITPITADLYNYSAQIMSDMHEVSGVSEYSRGQGPATRRTATEAAMIQDSTNARATEKLTVVEGFITNIARKLMQLAQQFITGEQVARINGRNGEVFWLEFEREDIQGEFDFVIEAGSTQPKNETNKRQQAVAMAQVLLPFVQLGVVDPQHLARHLLQQFGVKSPELFMGSGQAMAPPGAEGTPMAPGGEPGLNGEQPAPSDLLEAQQGGPGNGGIDPNTLAQLASQVGLNL